MSTEMVAVELQRERWRRARLPLHLLDPTSEDFASRTLVALTAEPTVRLLILPAGPEAVLVEFDEVLWFWWLGDRPDPITGDAALWGAEDQPTAAAAVRGWRGGGQWERYLALYRHGGLELGSHGAIDRPGGRIFWLSLVVGRLRTAFDLYRHVAKRFGVAGPWEVTPALRRTAGSQLGHLGEGWAEPGAWQHQFPPCREPGILLRREFNQWPDSAGAQALAFSFGASIEDAWGVHQRRFIACRGQFAGQLDKATWRWA